VGRPAQELVFIGIGLDKAGITKALDACLVPTDEFTPEKWERLNDPFPAWGEAQTTLEPAE